MDGTLVTTHPLISMAGDAPIADAARLMSDYSVGALGVLDKVKHFAGIITERDLTWLVAQRRDLDSLTLGDVANDFPLVVDGPLTESEAAERMSRAHVRHLIVREDGDLRMFSMRDLFATPTATTGGADPGTVCARDIMSSPAVACRQTAFFEEIAEALSAHEISGMPVVDHAGHLVGVVSERDLAHVLGSPLVRLAVRRPGHSERSAVTETAELPRAARRARDVMTTPPVFVAPGARLDEIARLMTFHEINRVVVLEEKQLMGVVSRGDLLRAIAGLHRPGQSRVERRPVVIGSAVQNSLLDGTDPKVLDLTNIGSKE